MPLLDVKDSQKLVEKYGIQFVKSVSVSTEKELIEKLSSFQGRIAMKILSDEIVHKTEVGGVKLNISSKEEAVKAFHDLQKLVGFNGVLVQEMIKGTELIIGGKQDPQFGPIVLFGLGGIFVEVLKDVSIRICPIERKDAREMIQEIKGQAILKGVRGQKPINFQLLEDYLLSVSKLMLNEKIQELDLNPLIATENSIKAIDARVIR